MKFIAESKGLQRLAELKARFAERIRRDHEHRAMDCAVCPTPGACCLDAHFVNVRISGLEAEAINRVIDELPDGEEVKARIERTIEKYGLADGVEDASKTFACPLFKAGTGCLVHDRAKPLPCIHHACYENREDLPPDAILSEQEAAVEMLDRGVYGRSQRLPLPVALQYRSR